MYLQGVLVILFLFAFSYLLFPGNAYAYIDPGTGSYIIQLLLAGLLAVGFSMKIYWKKIKTYFENLFSKK